MKRPAPPAARVIAHRGASADAPENTAAAVRRAVAAGARAVECDVQLSRDGVPIVFHDSDLARLCGEPGRVGEFTARALVRKQVAVPGRSGEPARILTLAQWLALLPRNVLPVVELKRQAHPRNERRLARAAAAVLRRRRGPLAVISFSPLLVREAARLLPEADVGPVRATAPRDAALRTFLRLARPIAALAKEQATAPLVRALRRAGKEVWCFTVDEPAWMRRLVARGVTGIISNRPALALRVLGRRAR